MAKPLTAAAVERYKPAPQRRVLKDSGARSLYLVIQPSGHKSWLMRFRRKGGKPAKLTLGPVDLSGKEQTEAPVIGMPLSLVAARQLATTIHRDRALGTDVFADHAAAKRRRRNQAGDRTTFGPLVRQFIEEHARPKTRRWRETARNLGLIYPVDEGEPTVTHGGLAERWADRPVGTIDSHDVYGAVDEARRRGMPGLGRRNDGISDARGRAMGRTLSKLFGWLLQHRHITSDPSVGVWCPPAPKARERVLSDEELRFFWHAASDLGSPFGPLLCLLLLTGQRLGEVSGMRRDELKGDEWQLPGERTKNHKQHIVPLSPLARELIGSVTKIEECPFVFSTTGKRPVSGWSKTKARLDRSMAALAEATIAPWTLHDLRRTAVTGMADLGISPHAIEAVVNHISGAKAGVAGVYNRSEYRAEKKDALARWALHVQGLIGDGAGNVVNLHSKKRKRT
jgi:integrase